MAKKANGATRVLFLAASHGRRAVSIIRDDSKPAAMRFEVVFQTAGGGVAWAFAATRQLADVIVEEVR